LRGGRYFDARDTADTERVVIINETMARRVWPGRDAVGQLVNAHGGQVWKVIGVVGDVHHGGLEEAAQGEMYYNFRQTDDWSAIELVVRSSRPLASFMPDVRTAIKAFDPTLPSTEFTTLEQIVDHTVAPRRLITELLGLFSSLGLILASLGLYGVMAYSVSQRTREIGVRMALGAQRGDVLALVLRHGVKLTAGGIVIGLAGSLALTRVMRGLLYGVGPNDPLTFITIPVLFIAVALAACWLPARYAANTDPIEALRHE
jgi:putative ABC transport system permease protein